MYNIDQLKDSQILMRGSTVKEDCEINEDLEKGKNIDSMTTLKLKRSVIVKQYAPKTFEAIRKRSNVTNQNLLDSLEPANNMKQIQNAGEGAGASGSFFFFSADNRFIMKTMSKTEIKHMIRSLPAYYEHIDTFANSFLARIFGIFTVNIDKFDPLHVLIMQNSLPKVEDTELAYCFDIKGSSINREVLKHLSNHDL